MNTEIIKLGKGIVIPSSHDAPSVGTITDTKLLEELKLQAKNGYYYEGCGEDRKSTRLNSSHSQQSRMPSSA